MLPYLKSHITDGKIHIGFLAIVNCFLKAIIAHFSYFKPTVECHACNTNEIQRTKVYTLQPSSPYECWARSAQPEHWT